MPKLNTYSTVANLNDTSSFLAIVPTTGSAFNTVLIPKSVLLSHISALISLEAPNPIEMRSTSTHVQYREIGATVWIDLLPLTSIAGPQGIQGIQGPQGAGLTILGTLANTSALPASGSSGDGYLINGNLWTWNATTWTNVGLIQGPQGIQGIQGPQGIQGTTGQLGDSIMLQKTSTHVQWKQSTGATWTDLIALSEITGANGTNGLGDAPSDSKTYGRKNGAWSEVVSSGSGTGETSTPTTLTQANTTINTTVGSTFSIVLTGHIQFNNPSGLVDGRIIRLYIKQGTGGSFQAINWGSMWKWTNGTVPTLSTTAGAVDLIEGQYVASLGFIACKFFKGFA